MSDLSADEFQPEIVLPVHIFFYTLEQVAHMLDCSVDYMKRDILYYQGRDYGKRRPDRMRAINIAALDASPEWRISEEDFVIWLKARGITFHETVRPSRVSRAKPRKITNKSLSRGFATRTI